MKLIDYSFYCVDAEKTFDEKTLYTYNVYKKFLFFKKVVYVYETTDQSDGIAKCMEYIHSVQDR
jgi:hypothetical protein